jgi:dissimilatory sulfite reductase alpha subunit
MTNKKWDTPLLDKLEEGPWPSFVKELKKSSDNPMTADLLGLLERSYREKIGHWKHGGLVGVMGYGGGVIGRYSDIPEDFPECAQFHTMRINQPSGWFYNTEALRKMCDIWEKRGSGITNMHGSTGDMVLLGCKTEELEPIFEEMVELGFDLGGSGSDVRTPSCCNGQARCEWACYDTMGACYDITQSFQDELHRPAFPYKFKFKFSGCPNDCVASVARSDFSVIGTWKDDIQVDQARVKKYVDDGLDIEGDILTRCPTGCMSWDGKELAIDNANCVKCMHCINVMHSALAPGKERGATILLGAKAPIIGGALLASVLVPFLEVKAPFDDIKEIAEAIWDVWGEHGNNRERVGEFMQRVGLGNFLEQVGLDPIPEMVIHPRTNPYIFFEADDDEDE